MNKHLLRSLGLVTAGALLLAGCSASPEPQSQAQGNGRLGARDSSSSATALGGSQAAEAVRIDPRIVAMCQLPEPRFDFDSHRLSPQAASTLDQLATCFTTGPGAGKGLRLIGHADPRGELMYNFGLGQRRAGEVASALESRGMSGSKLATLSRGELDAAGVDDEGWAQDRRVEIVLVD